MPSLASLKRRVDTWNHNRLSKSILNTPPIVPQSDGLVLFSMIGTAVLLPYLVAVKSLQHHLQRGRIIILDDGTLTANDRAILAAHCGKPEIHSIHDVKTDPCPQGGTWERLLTILAIRSDDYVIQLDSDTVTVGSVPEVLAAITDNCSFSIAGGKEAANLGFLPIPAFARHFYPEGPVIGHVQALLESRLGSVPELATSRYARACSGFAGFARGGPGVEAARAFSAVGESLTGARWTEWGTEQISSNFVIANEAGSSLLPYNRYLNYWAEPWGIDAGFIHFVGTHRFDNGAYAQATRKAIAALGQ